eukprot:g18491.t1
MEVKGDSKELRFKNRQKDDDVRNQNILAACAVAAAVRTSLGPKGMDKMITSAKGDVIITNDGATILKKMDLQHPAARMLADLSHAQDIEAGDGTTSVVVIAGSLLTAAKNLLAKGIHPLVIARAFLTAQSEACKILRSIAMPAPLKGRDDLIKSAATSLNSKVVSANSKFLAPLAVDAVLKLIDVKTATNVDLNNVRIVKRIGGTLEDTKLVDGIVFDQGVCHAVDAGTSISNAKIGLIQYCLSAPKTNMENNISVDDYQQIDRILKQERKYILKLLKPIVKSGCNLLLIQKSILRDAVSDLALHYLSKYKIMVVKDIERPDIEFVCETLGLIPVADPDSFTTLGLIPVADPDSFTTLGLIPVADPDSFTAAKLGFAERAEEISTPGGKIIQVTGVRRPGRTVSVLIRGSNRLVLDEAERSLHDALCVIRSLVKERFFVPGGAAPEIEIAIKLAKFADTLGGMDGYCIKESSPTSWPRNAGLDPVRIVTELRKQHAAGLTSAGVNIKKGKVTDILEDNVLQPLLVSTSVIGLATEAVRTILKIDDIVGVR